jgi:redox-sensitive bicupin YhaK (pirin superfamily)
MKIIPRRSEERGHSHYGWLKSFHTFSIAPYVPSIYLFCGTHLNPTRDDYNHVQHGPLRVINEDRVDSGTGFGTHSHSEFEIFSYVVSGELEQ